MFNRKRIKAFFLSIASLAAAVLLLSFLNQPKHNAVMVSHQMTPGRYAVSNHDTTKDATRVIHLDGSALLHVFEGLGAIPSYEKLLYDYPEPQRKEILDYMFLPDYGAALQVLKVEIGYDGNNTAVAWPSYQRSLHEAPDFNRGYVWWLMKEAKKRNPDIRLSALHWGYPAWAKTNEQKAQFIFGFVKGAKEVHGLQIDYIGGNANENYIDGTPFINTPVTIRLRELLDQNGFSQVRIVVADEGSKIRKYMVVDTLASNPAYRDAVDVIGVHYKSRPSDFMPAQAYEFGKQVWSSEDGGGGYKSLTSGYGWVSQIMRLLLEVRMNGIIRWSATASVYDNMPWASNGFMKAKEPWSGYYEVGSNLWAFSHFTHFVDPGWRILNTADSAVVPGISGGAGGYIAFKDEQSGDYAVVFNTFDPSFPADGVDLEISLSNGLSGEKAGLWRSDFMDRSKWFRKTATVYPDNGVIRLHLDKGCVYTLSTRPGGDHVTTSVPQVKAFPFPYAENFDGYDAPGLARYFIDANGIFEVSAAGGRRKGKALRQVVSEAPIMWHNRPLSQPLCEVGDVAWTDYKVEVDVLLENPGRAFLGGRFDGSTLNGGDYLLEGYWLSIDHSGQWALMRKDPQPEGAGRKDLGAFVTLASGHVSKIALHKWATLRLEFVGARVSAFINGKRVAEIRDETYKNGNVVLGALSADSDNFFTPSTSWPNVQYDNFSVSPVSRK